MIRAFFLIDNDWTVIDLNFSHEFSFASFTQKKKKKKIIESLNLINIFVKPHNHSLYISLYKHIHTWYIHIYYHIYFYFISNWLRSFVILSLSLALSLFLRLFDLWLIGDLVDFIDISLFCSLNCSVYGYNYLILLLSSYNYFTISSYISNHFMWSLAKVKANRFLSFPKPESDYSYTQILLCRHLYRHLYWHTYKKSMQRPMQTP